MEKEIAELVRCLFSDDAIVRQRARYKLVKIGKPVITLLIGLQYLPDQHVRWEAMKTLSQIADPDSIPILINALENTNSDVRWLAAEGLIEIGKESVASLMEALEERGDSKILREGVHHVLKGLENKGLFTDDYDIIGILEDSGRLALLRPTAARIRLNK
ncbi:MAG: HEAT repeat domain-containing protein [Bacteroidetes bacterium]|nr:HEAT repeat domain-containing protein [Bacteroidota bacterium]